MGPNCSCSVQWYSRATCPPEAQINGFILGSQVYVIIIIANYFASTIIKRFPNEISNKVQNRTNNI